ncbi:MAG: dihydropteroate synthase [Thaumarchaeota archaeon]|nr:dihydropteroate synthase [Nitrososphaerota archaeon]
MKRTAQFGSLKVGPGFPVRVIAAVNVSPESFYKGSVATTPGAISRRVAEALEHGAEVIDVGAMSTAPYLKTEVTEEVEKLRIGAALRAIGRTEVTVSVDTVRAPVADFALRNGASVVNDVSGLKNDERMAGVLKDHGASLLAMAHSTRISNSRPITQVREALRETLRIAARAGIQERRIVLDPGIGFFREDGAGRAYSPQRLMPWHAWDTSVLAELGELEVLGRPLCVGLSRKSFLGEILKLEDPKDRLSGSLAATAIAVANGTDMVRTHDVKETVQAVRVAEAILRRGRPAGRVS